MIKKMQKATTRTKKLVLSLLEVSCTYYTGWNIVRKVKKRLEHLVGTNDDYCMCIAFICVHLERHNGEKRCKNQLHQRRSYF